MKKCTIEDRGMITARTNVDCTTTNLIVKCKCSLMRYSLHKHLITLHLHELKPRISAQIPLLTLTLLQVTTISSKDYVIQQSAVNTALWSSLSKCGMSQPPSTSSLTSILKNKPTEYTNLLLTEYLLNLITRIFYKNSLKMVFTD